MPRNLTVVAIGGNAISRNPGSDTAEEQRAALTTTWESLLPLLVSDRPMVVVHGNGPQVGMLLLAIEAGAQERLVSLTDAVAATQGSVGYLLVETLAEVLRREGVERPVSALLTRVVVDPRDPAFAAPTKPVGPFYTPEMATALAADKGWTVAPDSGRGYRRVVASPRPLEILEVGAIAALAELGHVVVAVGGGGIPVARGADGRIRGIAAVIDKDLSAARLALDLGADALVLLTGVEKVAIGFGTEHQHDLDSITDEELARFHRAGEFPPGSMGPKIEAALEFLRGGGRQVVITLPERAARAMVGMAGTRIESTRWVLDQAPLGL